MLPNLYLNYSSAAGEAHRYGRKTNIVMQRHLIKVLILFASILGYGQEYHPLLSNSGWCCETCFGTGCWYTEYPNTEPELINGELYYKIGNVYLQEDSLSQLVWYLKDGEKNLLYDFTLATNDTFQIELRDTIIGNYNVDKIDTISTLAGNRKRWILSLKDTLTIGQDTLDRNLIWIEGIGSTYGPLYHRTVPINASGTCLEGVYSDERIQIYQGYCTYIQGYWPDECGFISSGLEENLIEPTIVYFNSFGELVISSVEMVNQIRIFDVKGTLLLNQKNKSAETSFTISNHLPPGIYFCEMVTESRNRYCSKAMKSLKSP